MKKKLHFALALLIAVPMSSQPLFKAFKVSQVKNTANLLIKASPKADASRFTPKSSDRTDIRINTANPFKITYDPFGNEVSVIDPMNLKKDVWEYNATGKVLLNKYTETRSNIQDPWEKPQQYIIRTTTNADGIRTSIEHESYNEIVLNDQGLVTSYKIVWNEDESRHGTQTWDGEKLTGLTCDDTFPNGEYQNIKLDKIETFYTSSEFNPFNICYFDYLFGQDNTSLFFAMNGSGTLKGSMEGMDISGKLTLRSYNEEAKEGDYDASRVMKLTFMGMEVINYKFTPTDANGSYIFKDIQESDITTYTADYDQQGNLVKLQISEEANKNMTKNETYRYAWTYDADGKALKVETFYTPATDGNETMILSEIFTEWYDATGIDNIKSGIDAEILGATLYTISGTLVKTLTAKEAISPISLPSEGIYLLNLKTSKGNIVKKIMK